MGFFFFLFSVMDVIGVPALNYLFKKKKKNPLAKLPEYKYVCSINAPKTKK